MIGCSISTREDLKASGFRNSYEAVVIIQFRCPPTALAALLRSPTGRPFQPRWRWRSLMRGSSVHPITAATAQETARRTPRSSPRRNRAGSSLDRCIKFTPQRAGIEPIFDLEFAHAADVTERPTFVADGLHLGSLRLIHIPSQSILPDGCSGLAFSFQTVVWGQPCWTVNLNGSVPRFCAT